MTALPSDSGKGGSAIGVLITDDGGLRQCGDRHQRFGTRMVAAVAELLMFKLGHCEIQFRPLRDKTGSAHKTYRDLGPIQETWRDPLDQKSANGMVRPCSGPA